MRQQPAGAALRRTRRHRRRLRGRHRLRHRIDEPRPDRQPDEFAAESHQRAARAWKDGLFNTEVSYVNDLRTDETIRPVTTAQGLAALRLAFRTDHWAKRHPDLDWKVTAGNSSPVNDGAAALLVTSEEAAARLGLKPRARVQSFAVTVDRQCGSSQQALHFAAQGVIAGAYEVAIASGIESMSRVPIGSQGGAIAIGHPLGASGARLATTLLNVLEQRQGRYGLQVMCEAGGLANATIIERI